MRSCATRIEHCRDLRHRASTLGPKMACSYWHELIPEVMIMSNTEMLIRLVVGGGARKPYRVRARAPAWAAGIRTHMLVCVGSCLIMIVSQYGFSSILTHRTSFSIRRELPHRSSRALDFWATARSLPGARSSGVSTTAASIWTVAAVGLAVGGGLYLAASASTVIILIILAGIKPLEEAYRSRNQSCQLKIEVDNGSSRPNCCETRSICEPARSSVSWWKAETLMAPMIW